MFRTPIWVTLPSDDSVKIKLKPLSYKSLKVLDYSVYAESKSFITNEDILLEHIVDTFNCFAFPSTNDLVNSLLPSDKEFLIAELLSISTLNDSQIENIKRNIYAVLDPKLDDESWNCEACKAKKLQTHRACDFIPKEERLEFKMRIRGLVYTQCPISLIDKYIVNAASECYSLMDSGNLPEDGGLGNQTMWFVTVSSLYKSILRELEKENLETQ